MEHPETLWRRLVIMTNSDNSKVFFSTVQEQSFELEVERGERVVQIKVNDRTYDIRGGYHPGENLQTLVVNGKSMTFRLARDPGGLQISRQGRVAHTQALTKLEHELYELVPEKKVADTSNLIMSPMPGKVLHVYVAAGETVEAGQEIAVIEAMKMENMLRAERTGTVAEVFVAAEDTVDTDQILVRFETEEE